MERSKGLELAPETAPGADEAEKGFWKTLRRGLLMTHTEIIDRLGAAMSGREVLDATTAEHLEEVLIQADLGVVASTELVEKLRKGTRKGEASGAALRQQLAADIAGLLSAVPQPAEGAGPRITLVVGVNGVGKTTSIAKLARRSQLAGEQVLMAAADTFRAAAIDQLELWGKRLGVEVIRQGPGADPAAVVFDALQAARARGATEVLIDTAGRLHTKENLMAELAKVRRVVDREGAGYRQRTLLVLDATTGQNALAQARRFLEVAKVDGVLLAKVDGTAKGGIVVAIARELKLPVLYLGVGETAEDLVDFRPQEFAAALLG
ncbi:MAG: signal recognition particle-docking protein FtsY [Thermoanaerobaculia bacterium]